jgi:hypothetical protein
LYLQSWWAKIALALVTMVRTIITYIGSTIVFGTCIGVWLVIRRQKLAAGVVPKAEITPKIALTLILIAIAVSISLAIQFEKLQ